MKLKSKYLCSNIILGSSGTPVSLQSNYFKLISAPDWCLYQYSVEFSPPEDRTITRKGLLRKHKEEFGAYVFDGTTLFTSKQIPEVKFHLKIIVKY